MPGWSIIGIRLALCHFLVGLAIGVSLMGAKVGILGSSWLGLVPGHTAVMMFGWMTQFAVSVAFWILPRLEGDRRGREQLFVLSLAFLNFGTLLLAFGQHIGYGLILLGLAFFAAHAFPRVRRLSPSELLGPN